MKFKKNCSHDNHPFPDKTKGTQLSSFICMANQVLLFSCSGAFPLHIDRGKSSQTPYSQKYQKTSNRRDE